jgi:hypothetical protein
MRWRGSFGRHASGRARTTSMFLETPFHNIDTSTHRETDRSNCRIDMTSTTTVWEQNDCKMWMLTSSAPSPSDLVQNNDQGIVTPSSLPTRVPDRPFPLIFYPCPYIEEFRVVLGHVQRYLESIPKSWRFLLMLPARIRSVTIRSSVWPCYPVG